MAKEIKTISYDEEYDIFYLSNGDNVRESIDIGDFVLDVNHNNLICGVEIMDASENLGINKETLKAVKNIKMSVNYKTNHVYVLLIITFKKSEKEANISIPITLGLGHKFPKKEVLVYN